VQKLAVETLQDIRIKYRWQAIDQENEAMEKAKLSKKRFKPILLANHDTIKQVLARSRYFLIQKQIKVV
jgi:transposase